MEDLILSNREIYLFLTNEEFPMKASFDKIMGNTASGKIQFWGFKFVKEVVSHFKDIMTFKEELLNQYATKDERNLPKTSEDKSMFLFPTDKDKQEFNTKFEEMLTQEVKFSINKIFVSSDDIEKIKERFASLNKKSEEGAAKEWSNVFSIADMFNTEKIFEFGE